MNLWADPDVCEYGQAKPPTIFHSALEPEAGHHSAVDRGSRLGRRGDDIILSHSRSRCLKLEKDVQLRLSRILVGALLKWSWDTHNARRGVGGPCPTFHSLYGIKKSYK